MSEKRQSDFKRAFLEDGEHKTHIGGQALIEGIMMRGRHNWAAAIRTPSGRIHIESYDLLSGNPKHAWLRLPLIRGVVAFVESLVLGYKALDVANMYAYTNDDEMLSYGERIEQEGAPDMPLPSEIEAWEKARYEHAGATDASVQRKTEQSEAHKRKESADKQKSESKQTSPLSSTTMALSMIIGIVLGAGIFVIAPAFLTNLVVGEYDVHTFAWNMIDGLIRIAIFIFYVWLIGRMKPIQRMFGYHGAEHKTIHCFEHGLPLTPENAMSFPRLHVRCGTAFLIMVMLIAILVYSVVPIKALISIWGIPDGAIKLTLVIVVRLLLMPLIAGISYEISVKWAGSHPENPLVKIILWPGLQMQYLTTREPDAGQIECAIKAMEAVVEREKGAESARVAKAKFSKLPDALGKQPAYTSDTM